MVRFQTQVFIALCILIGLALPGHDVAHAQARRIIKDPGGPSGSTIVSEERYVDKYYHVGPDGAVEHHIYLGDQRIGTLRNGTELQYPIADHVGSTVMMTNQQGEVAETLDYQPFGSEALVQTWATSTSDRRFLDKEVDGETAFQYFGARYYDNRLGRFSSTDPLLSTVDGLSDLLPDPQQLNSYAYGRNNPMILFDPTGEKVELITRPVQEHSLGAHAFVLITNTQEDARRLIDVPGVSDKSRITLGGYNEGNGLTGNLVKRANDPYDFSLLSSQYISAAEVAHPDHYGTQTEFENSILRAFNSLPETLGAYSFIGHPRSERQANSNNVASTVLMRAGVSSDAIIHVAQGGLQSRYSIAPGLGSALPPKQSVSVRNQWNVVKYLAQRAAGKVFSYFSGLKIR